MAFTIKAADLFCGAGGASTGLVRAVTALGLDLDLLAINHWPTAIRTHELNHPGVRHLCASLEHVKPREHVPGGRLHLLLAGPECTHHSQARGGKPINDQSRATAWCIPKWASDLYIDTIIIENVPEFRTWGPLGADDRPLKSKKGETYQAYLGVLRSLGYKIEERIVNCADYGDATTRQRLFLICHRGKRRIQFPQATHAKVAVAGRRKWKAAREVIDWTLTGQSIFNRKKPLERATVERIMAGLDRFGGEPLKPFLVVLRNHMDGKSIDGPLPTITAGANHIGLAEPFLVTAGGPIGQGRNPNSVNDPLPTILAENKRAVVQPVVMHTTHGGRAHEVDKPLPTVTGAHRGELGVIEPFVLSQASGGAPRPVGEPIPTLCADGAHSLVQPFMVPMYGERPTQTPRTHSVEEPVPTIPASGDGKFGVVQPFIVPQFTNPAVASVDKPLGTLTTTSRGVALVQPVIIDALGAGDGDARRGKPVDEPLGTVSGSNRFGVADASFLQSYYGTLNISSVDQPVPTVTTKERFALVMPVIDGLALDIRFRMLQPHELAGAHSFPKGYLFGGNKGDMVKMIGNSWPGETSRALCLAALRHFVKANVEDDDERRTA